MQKRSWTDLQRRLADASLHARPFAIAGVGECSLDEVDLVERLPRPGEKLAARRHLSLGGGQIATALVAARRLGVTATFFGAIGDDLAGRAIEEGLRDEGIDLAGLVRVTGAASRSAAILVEPSGERTIVERRDAALAAAVLPIPRARAAIVHADATIHSATLDGVIAAQDDGALLSIDVEKPSPIADALLARADVAVVSEHYLAALGVTDDAAMVALDRTIPGVLIATRGAAGLRAVDRSGGVVAMPRFVVDVVDTTACGDTFRGALLVALYEGQTLDAALRFASAAAALKCRDYGRLGCPTRAVVDAFLG